MWQWYYDNLRDCCFVTQLMGLHACLLFIVADPKHNDENISNATGYLESNELADIIEIAGYACIMHGLSNHVSLQTSGWQDKQR